MFEKLFAESGLSLDRLRALVEIGAAGSIVKAAAADPVRQSQYSRQVRELEDFFRVKLIERHGKGTQLTQNGRELARISRFFLLGLSNFQRGSLAEEQTFRVGASPTLIQELLVPIITQVGPASPSGPFAVTAITAHRFILENVFGDDLERRLHELTLDFAIVTTRTVSRPLQVQEIGASNLSLFVPKRLYPTRSAATRAFATASLPLALALPELDSAAAAALNTYEPRLICDSFLSARQSLESQNIAAVLPDPFAPIPTKSFWQIRIPGLASHKMRFSLAWNPRLLRLNPHVVRTRDLLARALRTQFAS